MRRRIAAAVVAGTIGLPLLAQPAGGTGADATATAALFDDDADAALFPAGSPLRSGERRAACIAVGTTASAPGKEVTLAARDVDGALGTDLTVRIEAGTGANRGDCTGFAGAVLFEGTLAELAALDPPTGLRTGWSPTEPSRRSFRITTWLRDDPAAAGRSVRADLVWQLEAVDPNAASASSPSSTAPPRSPAGLPPAPASTDGNAPGATEQEPGADPAVGSSADVEAPDVLLRADPQPAWRAVLATVARIVTGTAAAAPYPVASLLIAAAFLSVQNWLDRRDPKLARAARSRRDIERLVPDPFPATPSRR